MTKEEARRALEALGDKRPEPDKDKLFILGPSGKRYPAKPVIQQLPAVTAEANRVRKKFRVRRCPFCDAALTPIEYWEHACPQAPEGFEKPAMRASGDIECPCSLLYRDHPYDWEQLSNVGEPFLHILCDGTRVKL